MPRFGPVTKAGKYRASLNAVKHGLNSRTFLPCRKDDCYFWLACSYKGKDGSLPGQIKHGDPCPVETTVYQALIQRYSKALGGDLTNNQCLDIHQLALTEIRLMRVYSALAIHPELTRWVPGSVPEHDRPAFTLPVRYKHEINMEWHARIGRLFPQYTLENSPSSDR